MTTLETQGRIAAATDDRNRAADLRRSRLMAKFANRSRTISILYLLMMPTILSMLVFGYYPKLDVIIKAFYRWTPGEVEEFIGAGNFTAAVADPLFWQSFKVVAIMLVANLFKMWPAIIVAIALHRILSDRWRYIYQVAFVIPMVVPGLVWLLIWKSFYDPDFGILNQFLSSTGAMGLLAWLDGTKDDPGVMPRIAATLAWPMQALIAPVFGSVWGILALGGFVSATAGHSDRSSGRYASYASLLGLAALPVLAAVTGLAFSAVGFALVAGMAVFLMFMLACGFGTQWVLWTLLLLGGIWAFRGDTYLALARLPIAVAVAIAVSEIVRRLTIDVLAGDVLKWIGVGVITVGSLFVAFGIIWSNPTGQFVEGTPAWIGNKDLVLPALIFWGFPWVGTVGVLIYLAGLQQISNDVYEAADLDGVGPVRRLFQIELPLIMTQVRINLIFMTIGTLTSYEFFLILLGPDGGPGSVGIVPGLYMYKKAFVEGEFGYACALGMVMFFMILLLTVIYQKYVKVEK